MSTPTQPITEADVVAFLQSAARAIGSRYGGRWGSVAVLVNSDGPVSFTIGASELRLHVSAGTLQAAIAKADDLSPESIAARLRAEADQVLADAAAKRAAVA